MPCNPIPIDISVVTGKVYIHVRSTGALVLRTELARSGTPELTKRLLENGYLLESPEECLLYRHERSNSTSLCIIARVNPRSTYVKDAFRDSITRGDSVSVNYLLERGCDPNMIWEERHSYWNRFH